MEIKIKLDRQSKTPLYRQIASQIIDNITVGTLKEGVCLPAERKLAAILGVNRSTVINAYHDLEKQGYVTPHVGKGTVVTSVQFREQADSFGWQELLSGHGESLMNAYNFTMSELLRQRDLIAMDSGIAAPELYPKKKFAEICQKILFSEADVILQYDSAHGIRSFRETLTSIMQNRSVEVSPDNIIVLNGSQEGLDLISRILLEPGDCVIMEEPTFLGAIDIFRAYGVRIIGVPVDSDGMVVSRLENIICRVRPKFIYTIPTFQNPTGVCMSMERRQRLLEIAGKHHIPIIEDDAYGLLNYGESETPALKSLDKHGNVVYVSSMSKMLCPGLRLGWMATPPSLTPFVAAGKQLTNLHTNNVLQRMVDLFYREGHLQDHIIRSRRYYSDKLHLMLAALEKHAPRGLQWNKPTGGFYIWATLPENLSAIQVLQEAVKNKVSFVAGPVFYHNSDGHNKIRLNFSYTKPELINEGIKTLCYIIKNSLKDPHKWSNNEIKPMV